MEGNRKSAGMSDHDNLINQSAGTSDHDDLFNLSFAQVSKHSQNPYILHGYRLENLSPKDCVRSCFLLCNETANIWTHVIALIVFISMSVKLFSKEDVFDPLVWPLLTYSVGICFMFLSSVFAHTFCAVSPRVHHTCFFVDYAGVAVFTMPAGQCMLFYMRALEPELTILKYPALVFLFTMTVSTLTTIMVALSRFKWHNYRYFIRTFTFIVPFLIHTFPLTHRLITCSSEVDCEFQALPHLTWHIVWYLLAVLVTALHIPERLFPGKFDYIGYSHSLMHILVALGAYEQFRTVELDFNARREMLSGHQMLVTFWNSLAPFGIAAVLNVGIAFYLGVIIDVEDSSRHKKHD